MPRPALCPRTAPAVAPQRCLGVRAAPHLALVLAAVVAAHLWVLDAWSRPAASPVVAPIAATSALPSVTALPAPAAAAAPVAAPAPLPVASPARPVQKATAVGTAAATVAATTKAAAPMRAPDPDPTPLPLAEPPESLPATAPEPDRMSAEALAEPVPEPLQLALATVGSGAGRSPPAASQMLVAPPSMRLRYRMKRGPLAGTGQIDWQRDAGSYRMRLEARVPVFGLIFMETSTGQLDASGLVPLRHTERRLKRSERALSFVRDQGPPRIAFSAREGTEPLRPGAQDRLSWIAQLAARMAAPPAGDWRPGSRLEMDVASTGGDVQHWIFTVQGRDGSGLWQLRREPDTPSDTRAEVWIDPLQHHWPVRIRLSEPSGDPLELVLDGLQPA